jgi:cell wall-associated NlpC family hydrolase
VGRRLFIAAAVFFLVQAGGAAASTKPSGSWAGPEIRTVTAAGLMGTKDAASFHPGDRLTAQTLEDLVFGLKLVVFPPDPTPQPPPLPPAPNPPPPPPADPTLTDPTQTTPAPVTPPAPAPAPVPVPTPVPVPVPAPAPVPSAPRRLAQPDASVTMAKLDLRLVQALGLGKAANEFVAGARAAGLKVPGRFGTEVVARLLGLRTNHPAEQDSIELLPNDPATRAEAAYSAAQVLRFSGWEVAGIQSLADGFALPQLSSWQTRILDTAVARIGMPYIWGGTSDGPETEFGVPSRGGYDCSGFVWRVYKLEPYPGSGALASMLRGRTTFQMSGEVPASKRIHFADLQPADVIFFGDNGPRSQPAQVGHMGIYIGNGWFIHSSEYGVALATLDGWYRRDFAWARRPLAEAGLPG